MLPRPAELETAVVIEEGVGADVAVHSLHVCPSMTGFASLPLAESGPPAAHLAGVSKIRGPTWLRMPALTVGMLGVQVLWSVEMSYASPYLLSLGLSKSWMAMVFLAGPLSGLIVQPVIGVCAQIN